MALTVAVLREIDRTGDYEKAFHAISNAYNARQLTGPSCIPLRDLMSPDDAARVIGAAAEKFRTETFRSFQQRAFPAGGGQSEQ